MKRFLSAFGVVILVSLGIYFTQPKPEPSFGAPVNTFIKYVSSTAVSADIFCLTGDLPCISTWPTGGSGTNDWAVSSTYGLAALTTTSSINIWAKQSLYVSSTLLVDGLSTFTYVSSTGFSSPYVSSTNLTAGNLTVVTSLSLPANSITDAMVANDITASNYLLLTGGTLTGGLSFTSMSGSNFFATNVSSTFASSTYTSTTALTAHAFFQNGLTDCSADNQALNYTLATGLITCGDDDSGSGGVNDWGRFGTTFNTSSLMTSSTRSVWLDGSLFVSSSAHFAGLQVSGNLSASSTLTVGGLSFFSSLSTFSAGFISSASSSIAGGLTVNGTLNASTSLIVTSSLIIPYSTNPSLTTNGGLAGNDVSSSLRLRLGGTTYSFYPEQESSAVYASSTLAYDGAYSGTGTTTYLLANYSRQRTLTSLYCKIRGGAGSGQVEIGNGTSSSTVNCTTSGAESLTTVTFTQRQNYFIAIGNQKTNPNLFVITDRLRTD